MLFDSHCHLNFEAFAATYTNVIADCQAKGIQLINIGAQFETSKKSIAIADQVERGVYSSVGLHPVHVVGSPSHPEEFDQKAYASLIESSAKVVAIGETGIDFFHDDENLNNQQAVFVQHIQLAKQYDKALVVHGRNSRDGKKNAYEQILSILKQEKPKRAVVHCFGGNLVEAQAFLELGYYIGVTGIVTFKNATELATIVTATPLGQLLIETDAPYLAPEPHRGQENTPQYVEFVARKIAELKGLSFEQVAEQTTKNAINFYGLG